MAMKHATSKLRQFDYLYQNNKQNTQPGNDNNNTNGDDRSYIACAPTLQAFEEKLSFASPTSHDRS